VTLRDEITTLHKEHQDLHHDAEDISKRERSIKWQVSVQNALGVVLAASIMGVGTLLWHWYNAAGEVRAEITKDLTEIREWQAKHSAFAEYGAKDVSNAISRIETLEKFANHGKRFTWDDGQEHTKRIAALELAFGRQHDHETRMRALESGFASIQGSLQEIIRRLDIVHRGASRP
jgi:hypothetical protein